MLYGPFQTLIHPSAIVLWERALAAPWGECPTPLNPEIVAHSESIGSTFRTLEVAW
jgi:hypothetical protein